MKTQRLWLGRLLIGLMGVSATELNSQTNLGTIRGTTLDTSDAAIPGVALKLTNESSGMQRSTLSDELGNYEFPTTQPGTYTIQAEKSGFKTATVTGFILPSGATARLNLTLPVGEIASAVEVHAAGQPLVQTDTGTLKVATSSRMLKGLPTVGGDFNNFLASAAFSAAIFLGSDGFDGVKTPNYSFNLNGADVSSAQANNAYIWIPVEALDEVTVSYNSGSAEAGFGAAQISGVTKRGTNSFHGSLYEYYASNLWSTRPEFAVGVFHPSRYDRNEFGFTIGGPVILPKYNGRNKTFFFLAWDDYISRGTQGLATGSSPTAKMRTGDFSEVPFSLRDPLSGDTIATQVTFPNNVIPASRIAPVALRQWATKLGDLPNLPTLVNNLVIPVLSTNNRDGHQLWAARVDQNLGSRDVLTVDFNGLFSYTEQYQDRAGAQTHNIRRNLPQSPNYNVGGQWLHTFTPRMFSETTFNRRYFAFRQLVFPNGDPLWYKTNGVTPPPGLVEDESKAFTLYGPLFTFSGNGATDRFGPFAETPVVRDDAGIFFAERFSYVRGRHTLKFGAEYKLERMTPDFTGNWRGTFNYVGANTPLSTGWAAADFLLGLPNSVSYRGVQSTVQPRVTRPRYASYVQDEWKVAPKLTVNLGLRWEYLAPLTEDNNMLAQFDLTSKQIVVAGNSVPSNLGTSFAGIPLVAASSVGLGGNLWRTPRANFTPRFSVAFRPFGGTRTVVRAGYGMYYQDEGLGNQYGAAQSAPFVYSITAITQPGAGRITWSNPFPAASVQKQGFSTRPRDWPVERFQQWNFTIEREVGWNSAVSLAYLGSRVGLGSVGIDSNYPTVAGINPDGTLNQVRPFAAANAVTYQSSLGYYRSHAMQVDLRRRFAQGLSFDGEFLWMKAIDNNWPSSYTGPVSYLPLETGRSAGTRKFTFVDRFLWDLPVGRQRSFFAGMNRALDVAVGGWTLAGIFTAQTGYYFNPTFSNGFAAYGLLGSRPNSVSGARWDQNVPAGYWFNPAAFEVPPQPSGGQVVLGNAGRNTIPGPGLVNLTLTISKFFTIYESHRIELKAEAYGALNHPNLSPPSANISVPSTVGRIFSASGTRSWHFAMRYEF